jgi:transposase
VYRRLAARRGVKRAIMAVAHRLLIAAYHMLLHHERYREPVPTTVDTQRKAKTVQRLQRRIEQLGYQVQLEALPTAVT